MVSPADGSIDKVNNLSEYGKLLAEAKKEMFPINEKARKDIVEYLLGRYIDEGLPLNVLERACGEALQTIRKKEEEFDF